MYNVTQAARYASVSGTTIRGWARDYSDYLSPTANPPAGQPRQFVEDDLKVFSTVATLRAQLATTEDIRAALDAGQRLEPVRPPLEDDRADPADQAAADQAHAAAAAASTALTLYSQQVNALQTKNDALADRLIEAERRIADERAARAAAEKELEVMRQLYEAATSPAPGSTRPTFWQWLTGRK